MRPVHKEKVFHHFRIGFKKHSICGAEFLAKGLLMHAREAGGQCLEILYHDLIFKRATGSIFFGNDIVQFVELKNFGKIVKLPGKSHHGKTRQVFVFKHVAVKGRQELARFNQRVAGVFLIGLDQAQPNMHCIQKMLEFFQIADVDGGRYMAGVLPLQSVLREDFLPCNHCCALQPCRALSAPGPMPKKSLRLPQGQRKRQALKML